MLQTRIESEEMQQMRMEPKEMQQAQMEVGKMLREHVPFLVTKFVKHKRWGQKFLQKK